MAVESNGEGGIHQVEDLYTTSATHNSQPGTREPEMNDAQKRIRSCEVTWSRIFICSKHLETITLHRVHGSNRGIAAPGGKDL